MANIYFNVDYIRQDLEDPEHAQERYEKREEISEASNYSDVPRELCAIFYFMQPDYDKELTMLGDPVDQTGILCSRECLEFLRAEFDKNPLVASYIALPE